MLIDTSVVFNPLYLPINSLLLGIKWLFKQQNLYMFGLKLDTYMSNFQPLEVAFRDIARHNLNWLKIKNKLTQQDEGQPWNKKIWWRNEHKKC